MSFSPHIASATEEARLDMARMAAQNIIVLKAESRPTSYLKNRESYLCLYLVAAFSCSSAAAYACCARVIRVRFCRCCYRVLCLCM